MISYPVFGVAFFVRRFVSTSLMGAYPRSMDMRLDARTVRIWTLAAGVCVVTLHRCQHRADMARTMRMHRHQRFLACATPGLSGRGFSSTSWFLQKNMPAVSSCLFPQFSSELYLTGIIHHQKTACVYMRLSDA